MLLYLMPLRASRSTLFPYTTLFRSSEVRRSLETGLAARPHGAAQRIRLERQRPERDTAARVAAQVRSEEHTSELQSRQYLVCRLLLEKKKATEEPRSPRPSTPTKPK